VVLNIFVLLISFLLMEGVAWACHKYLMHGPLWYLHEDHHRPEFRHHLQKNDLFFVIFSLPAMILIFIGVRYFPLCLWAGAGITLYGAAYFLVHESIIHGRFRLFPKSSHPYVKAIRKAHGVHHAVRGREGAESFGMLFVHPKYFREAWRRGRGI